MNNTGNHSGIVIISAVVLALLVSVVNGDNCDAATRVQ